MQLFKLIVIFTCLILGSFLSDAQQKITYDEVDATSYDLYINGKWKTLLDYGKTSINGGQDFIYLRLRMGYAAVMLQNFSEALKHYNHVLKKDRYNEIARYYAWYCLINLHQPEQAYIHVPYFSKEAKTMEHISKRALRDAGIECSNKFTDITTRNNSIYNKVSLNTRLGWKTNMEHSFITYNQIIDERGMVNVTNNSQIIIHQKEYYNKTTISLDNLLQLKIAYHFIQTPFNSHNISPYTSIVYKNNLWMIGLKYHDNYCTLQGSIITGKITDTTIHQYNFQATYFPKGNMNFYGISTISLHNRKKVNRINMQQILGCKLNKYIWLEANATFGRFSNYSENDLTYVYNAIDENRFKSGMNAYLQINKHILAQAGYTFEQRELYHTNFLFNQHSINGGITWKF